VDHRVRCKGGIDIIDCPRGARPSACRRRSVIGGIRQRCRATRSSRRSAPVQSPGDRAGSRSPRVRRPGRALDCPLESRRRARARGRRGLALSDLFSTNLRQTQVTITGPTPTLDDSWQRIRRARPARCRVRVGSRHVRWAECPFPPPHRGPENPLFRDRPKATIYPSFITGILASGRRCDHRRSSVWVCRNRRARSRDHGRRSPRGLGSDDGRKNPPVALLTTGFNPPRSWIGRRVPSGSSVPRLEVARHSDLVVSMVLRCSPPTWGRYPGMRRTTAAPRLVITRSGTYLPRPLSRDRNVTACTMIMHERWSSCEYRIRNIRCQQKKSYVSSTLLVSRNPQFHCLNLQHRFYNIVRLQG
jgi:hypothetical protein